MKLCLCIVSLSLLAGCMTASVPTVSYWYVTSPVDRPLVEKPKYGVVRISQVIVRAPFDSRQIVVRRADGSIAFDAYNNFAALPSQLFKAPVIASIANSGLCTLAVDAASSARTDDVTEAIITDLALTTADDGTLNANVSVIYRLLDQKRDIVSIALGSGIAAVENGSLTHAFSAAFAKASSKALSEL